MKKIIDINCDLGEGIGHDEAIMPFISSANIACGLHAGNKETIYNTINLCMKYNVAIGAHPSFDDRAHFGRMEMAVPPDKLFDLITNQIQMIKEAAKVASGKIEHVKPHGALYNMSATNIDIASVIIKAIKAVDDDLILFGLSGSLLISEAARAGIKTMNEAFADRTYCDDGKLTPRSKHNALILDSVQVVHQVMKMINSGTVTSTSGKEFSIAVDTICIHGDGAHAVGFAKEIHDALNREGIHIAKNVT